MVGAAEGIEALANTRVVIRPAGKMADEGYVASYRVRHAVHAVCATLCPLWRAGRAKPGRL